MNDTWKEAIEHTFSSTMNKSIIKSKYGDLEFLTYDNDKWVEPVIHMTSKWGYHTQQGWKSVDSLSLFPPMTNGFEESEWFDPYKYSELLYMKLMYTMEFISENANTEYRLEKPNIIDDNVVYFQVMNLNSRWSSFSHTWTFNPDFTVYINGMVYPVQISTRGLVDMIRQEKLLEVGTKITATESIEMAGLIVKI